MRKTIHHFIGSYPILFFVAIVIVAVLVGTTCFHFIEGRDIFNSFYFTSVTMATIGYGDVAPLTYGGKVTAIIYGFMGAPLFIGLTGLLFQSKFQKLVKRSIHSYHKEIKEAKKITEALAEENEKIQEITENINTGKKSLWKKLFKK